MRQQAISPAPLAGVMTGQYHEISREASIPRLEKTALGEWNGESSGALKRDVQCRA
jgi:hypothetical protein